MKAKELMIGDWVFDSLNSLTKKPLRVDGACIKYAELKEITEQRECFDPIPLTYDMIGKNKIVCLWHYENCYPVSDKKHISLRTNHDKNFEVLSANMQLKYVHELQHALRLCGMFEIADNFKIE